MSTNNQEDKFSMFEKTIKDKTDKELINILKNSQNYQPEFIELVIKELSEIRDSDLYKDFLNGKPESNEWNKWFYSDEPVDSQRPAAANTKKDQEYYDYKGRKDQNQTSLKSFAIFGAAFLIAHIPFLFISDYVTYSSFLVFLILITLVVSVGYIIITDKRNYFFGYIRRIYRLSLKRHVQEDLVWKDLKEIHSKADWRHGIYEKDKLIETIFDIADNKLERYYYLIHEGYFNCRVKVLDKYPIELATDLFILAAHFNNLLNYGVVRVDTESLYVEYNQKIDVLIPLLYTGTIYQQLLSHYKTSKDIHWAFQQLVEKDEAPAIIIADLLKKIKDEEGQN